MDCRANGGREPREQATAEIRGKRERGTEGLDGRIKVLEVLVVRRGQILDLLQRQSRWNFLQALGEGSG